MIAKNFKFLYKYYKDKQKVLAKMFGVPQSDISYYVNGKKPIPTEILNCISVRYEVSIEDLINKDLSQEYDFPQIIELKDFEDLGKSFIPILTSNVAKRNDSFIRANEKLIFCCYKLEKIEDIHYNIYRLEHAITLFQRAWEESGSYVALSNCISTILFIYMAYNQRCVTFLQKVKNKDKLTYLDIQDIYLHNPKELNCENPHKKQQKRIYEKYEELVYENIKLLKTNICFSELGDYFLALCYIVGFADDDIDFKLSQKVGGLMLLQLYNIENKYAEKLLDNFPEIS